MRLSLDDYGDGNYWAAFGDIALAVLLVFILGVLSQFHRVITWQVIERRQDEIQGLVQGQLPEVKVERIDSQHQRLTFSSDALFPECKVDLTARGVSVLRMVGQILREKIEYFEEVRIEGHTDVRPPKGPPSCPVEDNWELSSQRATQVVRLLTEDQLLPDSLLSSIGRGEYHPAADITDYRENRRIELLLRYKESDILTLASSE